MVLKKTKKAKHNVSPFLYSFVKNYIFSKSFLTSSTDITSDTPVD